MKTRSQKEIVEGLLAKDRSSIGYLFDQYGGALLGVASRIVGNEEVAAEVLQNAFLKIWRNIQEFDVEEDRLLTWMLQIIRNQAIDSRRSQIPDDHEKTSPPGLHQDQVDERDVEKMHIKEDRLRNTIAGLDDDAKRVLNWIYFRGFTHKEVADRTDIPLETVKTQLRRAISELRKALRPQ